MLQHLTDACGPLKKALKWTQIVEYCNIQQEFTEPLHLLGKSFWPEGKQLVSVRKVTVLSRCCSVMHSESSGRLEEEGTGETGHAPAYVWWMYTRKKTREAFYPSAPVNCFKRCLYRKVIQRYSYKTHICFGACVKIPAVEDALHTVRIGLPSVAAIVKAINKMLWVPWLYHYTSSIPLSFEGGGGAGANGNWARNGVHPGQLASVSRKING